MLHTHFTHPSVLRLRNDDDDLQNKLIITINVYMLMQLTHKEAVAAVIVIPLAVALRDDGWQLTLPPADKHSTQQTRNAITAIST